MAENTVHVADYLYRYYDSITGRWPSRDSKEEDGGVNLYCFVDNNPGSFLDLLGMEPKKVTTWFADGRSHPDNFFQKAASFIVSLGNYRVVISKSTFPDEDIRAAAAAHEERHITSVQNSDEAQAVPYKQVFCIVENGKEVQKYFRFNGKELGVELFPENGEIRWSGETAVQLTTENAEGTEETKEAALEIAALRKLKTYKDVTDRIALLVNKSTADKTKIGVNTDKKEWAAFKAAVAKEKAKATFRWFKPEHIYPELK